jgi:hypothetical protein
VTLLHQLRRLAAAVERAEDVRLVDRPERFSRREERVIHRSYAGAIDQVVDAAVFLAHVRKELNDRRLIGDVNPAVLIVIVMQIRLVATAADDDVAGGESVLSEKPPDALCDCP